MNRGQAIRVWAIVAAVGLIVALLALDQLMPVARAQTEAPTPEPAPGATRVRETDGAVMVYVPAGEFLMGSLEEDGEVIEHPQHTVLLDAYWIDRTEVTNGQFEQFVKATGYRTDAEQAGSGGVWAGYYPVPQTAKGADWHHPEGPDSDIATRSNHPVVQVSWNDADAYCRWAGGRLPTEAEWEKAGRGTDAREYPWGNQRASCEYAVMFDAGGEGCGQGKMAWPVGSKPAGASPYGALDMAGNVSEWVADWFGPGYYAQSPANNPPGPDHGTGRSIRGGAWTDAEYEWVLRSAYRAGGKPTDKDNTTGFRCAVSGSQLAPSAGTPAAPTGTPSLQGGRISGVWGSSATDVFAVGASGIVLHYDGRTWSTIENGPMLDLLSVWGSSGSDVFVVGYPGVCLHYDGKTWSPMKSGTFNDLYSVWGSANNDVYAVGAGGTLLHYDGSTWSAVKRSTWSCLYGVWGSSAQDIFVVGGSGTILHYDGSDWSPMDSGVTDNLNAVWGNAGDDVFGVGDNGTIVHYDGVAWSPMVSGTSVELDSVWGSTPNDIFVVGDAGTILHYDGLGWSPMSSGTTNWLISVWGHSSDDVYAAGANGTLLHYDGTAWAPVSWQ